MSVLTIMIINIAAAGALSTILAAVMLASGSRLRSSQEREIADRSRAQRQPARALRAIEVTS